MYCTGSREIAKLSIEAVGEIDEYVSTEGVRCFHFWQLILSRYAETECTQQTNLCIIHCNTCVVFLIFKKYIRLTLYYYFSLKEYIPWFEVQPFLLLIWKTWISR